MKRLTTLLLALLIGLAGCGKEETKVNLEPVSQNKYLLGTIVNITLYDNPTDEVFNEVFAAIEEIENKMTINNATTSEVISINQQAGKDYVSVSEDTFNVIKRGLEFSELSKGRFDITIGSLAKLWEIGFEDAHVPLPEELDKAIQEIDYSKVLLDESNHSVKLLDPNMKLDLGGIAKGYAADVAATIIEKHGNKHAIINLGGNVYAYGDKPNGDPWRIGIQNPFSSRGESLGIMKIKDQTIVTSGIYERFFEQAGTVYHHILDPETGYPINNNLESVTILTKSSMDADALSTTTFALGVEGGLTFIESLDNVEALFVTKDKEIYTTTGIKDIFELTDTTFTLK
ncbi:MAG: FAD:protein FMN transferase [Turicibacter sp.]